ncbi:hypothetical protein HYH03_005938 [Edaphochlamys debaryana]|uniref:Uncharacterized protein n=1 Tax=Edaphochlamys debaryana TaxID=47281 RepID=A0A836C0N1_9CHLO|nr:hypothetical protein HYH03_005938 [Edaphochlamys debaryana]|eukprot:KAG2496016.1 hypothetical protein HYH03_005938 [Edaphochlamys debaryana]
MALILLRTAPSLHRTSRKACVAAGGPHCSRRALVAASCQPDGKKVSPDVALQLATIRAELAELQKKKMERFARFEAELKSMKESEAAAREEFTRELQVVKQIAVSVASVTVSSAASEVAKVLRYYCLWALSKEKEDQPLPPRNASERLLGPVADGDVKSFCASIDDVVAARNAAVRPTDLHALDCLVDDALFVATPTLRAAAPELEVAYRLLDKYQDVIRPLAEEAL